MKSTRHIEILSIARILRHLRVSFSEFVLFCVLSHAKQRRLLESQQRNHEWRHATSATVKESNAVIYGVGSIGRTVGKTLTKLGLHVRGIDPYTSVAEGFECIYRNDDMRETAAWSDYFIICAPLTEQTRHSVNAEIFDAMKASCHVINVGRGPIIDETALVQALTSGSIGSASLDVFETEPLPSDNPLWEMENVHISPHISGDAGDFELALIRQFADLADVWFHSHDFPSAVDKKRGYAHTRQN